ncbi:7368_t:CDS:1, partial [Funneliformis geosporum]
VSFLLLLPKWKTKKTWQEDNENAIKLLQERLYAVMGNPVARLKVVLD